MPAAAGLALDNASCRGNGWIALGSAAQPVIALSGDWIARRDPIDPDAPARILATGAKALSFDCGQLGLWDSSLIVFLANLRDLAQKAGVAIDLLALPEPARRLLDLVMRNDAAPAAARAPRFSTSIGLAVVSFLVDAATLTALIGSVFLRAGAAFGGRSALRGQDLLRYMADAGAASLPIVAVVNLLVGGILAFVGSVQLRRFGADIYITSLVGVTVVREMAALMTAVIMAGRTGGAYAATIAAMQGNEEIDALRAFGIPVFDYLVLPRIMALTAMMPILYLFGCAIGLFGGFLISVATLDISAASYAIETRNVVSLDQFLFGGAKSIAFGALIALLACQCGLSAGRSAADVGTAATRAVVAGVVGVIALDATFALCANAVGI